MKGTRVVPAFLGLMLLSAIVRLPYFLNPNGFDSDQAIVGLQALHLLRGEWSWFLWACGYQASFEPLLTAVASRVTPSMGYAMLLVGYSGFLFAIGFVFSTLRRLLGAPKAFLATLFVVLTATPTLWQTIYPPRMWAITFVFLSVWWLMRSRFLLAPLALLFAGYVDFIVIEYFFAVVLLGVLCLREIPAESRGNPARWYGAGLAIGFMFLSLTRILEHTRGVPLTTGFASVFSNAELLWNACLPWLLGYTGHVAVAEVAFPLWNHPVVQVIRVLSAVSLGVLFFRSLYLAATDRDLPPPVRNLAVFAAIVVLTTLSGFLSHLGLSDINAVRYLTPLLWVMPMALAPLMFRLSLVRAVSYAAPILIIAALAGSMGAWRSVDSRTDDEALKTQLRARGVTAAQSSYWVAYRLSLLFDENPVVVPLDRRAVRYEPHLESLRRARVVALVLCDGVDEQEWMQGEASRLLARSPHALPFRVGRYHGYTAVIE